ncbi:hypothetical protein SKAU_G00030480 [Synaphobranchus kaupii]|uniref:BOD1/SHG1 domain-containing protein n=1 Tax=Synaphobranchus kaupii TaxID=118154 RepID=A0A9Q1GEV9_SYNKA|nr:hypothetical protein SKAU_G00030480 [Synaphobranchus kaupii]
MAGLPPGDPQLVSMIVNHLKTQGLFDQFRRDCLADVDTKPAYLNLRQRVDNFVSNHLSNHTWSPHLNKNQLRNNIRQLVLQSGMLEQGVDRIVAQVVDPKIHHTFRPQVERVVREFLSPGTMSEQPVACPIQVEERQDNYVPAPGPSSTPVTTATSDAMSILDTITSLNQEASTWTSGRVGPASGADGGPERDPSQDEAPEEMEVGEQDMSLVEEDEDEEEGKGNGEEGSEEKPGPEALVQDQEAEVEDATEVSNLGLGEDEEAGETAEETREVKAEEGKEKDKEKEKDKANSKPAGKPREDGDPLKSPSEKHHMRQKARERLKEEYSLEDSDLDGLSDITVSSVHTSDLSSFEEESDEEPQLSDSTEEGEITSEEEKMESKQPAEDMPKEEEPKERKPRGGRQAYVHKPFLYSRYYSDSDDEVTVEQRRRSVAKEKEERLLKRQQNRERLEEKRRQKATQQEDDDEAGSEPPSPNPEQQGPSAKEARKQQKVLEKKVAISRKRKRDSRKEDEAGNKKGDVEEELKKSDEVGRGRPSKSQSGKGSRKLSESEDGRRRKSSSVSEEGPAGGGSEQRRAVDKGRTHSFILDLEQGSEGLLRQRPGGKFDRNPKHPKERAERDRSLSDERPKHKPKPEKRGGGGEVEESPQKDLGHVTKVLADDKAEKKSKSRGDRRSSTSAREGRTSVSEGGAVEEGGAKRARIISVDGVKADKAKTEKGAPKSDGKLLLVPQEPTGSSEDKSDKEPGSEVAKKKDRLQDVPKRSKSQSETSDAAGPDRRSRAGSDSDVDPGSKVKTAAEKSRSRSREDPKDQATPRGERKGSAPESKGKGAKPSKERRRESTSKEEKRREGSLKEEGKGSEENAAEKARKGVERKGAEAEKKALEEEMRQGSKGDEPSPGSSLSPPIPDTSIPAPLPDTSVGSDALPLAPPTTLAVGLSDDTFDGLSDITPEPEDEGEMQIDEDADTAESPNEGPSLGGGLGGSDVTVGQAQLGWTQEERFGLGRTPSEMSLREAALTLLSMDPDTTTSSGMITEATSSVPRQPESRGDEARGLDSQHTLAQTDLVSDSLAATEAGETQGFVGKEAPVHEQAGSAGVLNVVVKEVSVSEVSSASERRPSQEAGAECAGGVLEPRSEEMPAATADVSTPIEKSEELHTEGTHLTSAQMRAEASPGSRGGTGCSEQTLTVQADSSEEVKGKMESQVEVLSSAMETAANSDSRPDAEGESQSGLAGKIEGSAEKEGEKTEEVVAERKGRRAKTATKETGKEKKTEEKEESEGEQSDLAGEVRETRRGRQSRLVKQASKGSKSDRESLERSPEHSADDRETEEVKETRSRRGRGSQSATPQRDTSKTRKEETEESADPGMGHRPVSDDESEKAVETKGPRRGRSSKTTTPSLRETRSSSQELEDEELKEQEQPEKEKPEDAPVRRGRSSAAQVKEVSEAGQPKKEEEEPKTGSASEEKQEEKKEDEKSDQKKVGRRGRPGKAPPQGHAHSEETSEQSGEKGDGESCDSKETNDTCKPVLKRKRSEDQEDSMEAQPEEGEGKDDGTKRRICLPRDDSLSQSDGQEDVKEESSNDNDEDRNQPQKNKVTRRGRSSKGGGAMGEESEKTTSEKKEQKSEDTEEEQLEGEESEEEEGEEETKIRATTRSASRLEAERNKPSKPSTRALSKLSGKEETGSTTRGGRGPVSQTGKGWRKREPSPPTPRTRGGQKLEEPPAKRGKR